MTAQGPKFVMVRSVADTGRMKFTRLREALGDRLLVVPARHSDLKRWVAADRARKGLVPGPPEPHHFAEAEGNVLRKVAQYPMLGRLDWLRQAYHASKARHAQLAEARLREIWKTWPDAIALVHNGFNLPDSALADVAGPGRRIFLENGYFRGTVQADPQGINADNTLPRDPDFYRAYQPDERPLDLVPSVRVSKHGKDEVDALPGTYVFVPFQVESDSQITRQSPWIADMMAFHAELARLADRLPALTFVVKEHPNTRRLVKPRVTPHPRVLFRNGADTAALIAGASRVMTINSTVGIEALAVGKPVLVLGEACYGIEGLVQRAGSSDATAAALGKPPPDPDVDLRQRFLHYLYYHFLLRDDGVPDGRDAEEVLREVLARSA
ncbi:nitrogen fixation protein FixF [Pelagovum pacificum]|uniref:Nitrogen fixation protein FixF n=1 Tax=Pelagovum pacificum TaxID=2588711 RepID=A0A5C5G992_9RHOB|nr:nitrogen fixation protein FixF [Pelagovum pacificum]QQA42054.1 nitrogen fixation protein FixF [Pelagovum pacificum]TNY31143.1 nitrogen fixation protein FixF [Pelagovum pacificum]